MSNLITIEIFWDDLTKKKQQEFLNRLDISGPEDWNLDYNTIPVAIFETEENPDED